ncbi:glyoxalase [Kocuria polaris]|nr:glyoxalase [Kocuria polaris]
MRLKMTSVHVSDPASAYEFFTRQLGFTDVDVQPEHNLYVVSSPDESDTAALLLEPSDHPVAEAYRSGIYDARLPALTLGVPDVAAEYDRLSAAGVEFHTEPVSGDWGTIAVFDTGCGIHLQLHQD